MREQLLQRSRRRADCGVERASNGRALKAIRPYGNELSRDAFSWRDGGQRSENTADLRHIADETLPAVTDPIPCLGEEWFYRRVSCEVVRLRAAIARRQCR
jgi:hypothetical protein